MKKTINIIDLFSGPGGLGEGFSSFLSEELEFRIRMSIEREKSAHNTLTLRAFYRILKRNNLEEAYFDYIEGRIDKSKLTSLYPALWDLACIETMEQPTALGEDNEKIKTRLLELKEIYKGKPWVVIGGPPCQAYSLVGRARNKGVDGYVAEKDKRHFLYREYLNVLSILEPDIFVMENVKGILSSKVDGEKIFPKILRDLANPHLCMNGDKKGRQYRVVSFACEPKRSKAGEVVYDDNRDFIIKCESYGIPQSRHRVILLGIATDLQFIPETLTELPEVMIEQALRGLPKLRSKLSKEEDSSEAWKKVICDNTRVLKQKLGATPKFIPVIMQMDRVIKELEYKAPINGIGYAIDINSQDNANSELMSWLLTDKPNKVLNHQARGHMSSDLARYFFSACWANPLVYGNSDRPFPKPEDYPSFLAPNHANWNSGKFADRFRVQRYQRPATTITSHISKDGHYFIHPDATQCRSLTVREAARIQTFPDNYYFEGNRTEQYVQVGNAVPPFLANQLARIVAKAFK